MIHAERQPAQFAASSGSFSLGEITQRVGSGVPFGVGGVFRFFPFGHPPILAFSLAAAVFASEVALPPRRPRAWAALFIGRGFDLREVEAEFPALFLFRRRAANAICETMPDLIRRAHRRDPRAFFRALFSVSLSLAVSFSLRHNPRRADQIVFEMVELVRFVFGVFRCHVGDNSEPLGYCKRKVKFLLGGGGGSKNLPSALAKKNEKAHAQAPRPVRSPKEEA